MVVEIEGFMALVEIEELLVLFLVLVGYAPVIRAYTRVDRRKWLFAGYTALVIGRLATILEGFAAPGVFNTVEHGIGVMVAGGLFAVYTYKYAQGMDRQASSGLPTGGSQNTGNRDGFG